MSIRDLRKMGLLKPESEWTDRPPRSCVRGWMASVWLILAVAGCGLMLLGGGAWWTWIGLAAFVMALFGFVRLNIRSVDGSGLQ